MNPEDTRRALEKARKDSIDLLDAVLEQQAPNGLGYDDTKISDAEFPGWFADLAHTPFEPPFSALDYLPTAAPALYESLRRRYERIVAKNGAV